MKDIKWNEEKNEWLKKTRDVCFEDFVDDIKQKRYVAEIDNKNHPGQRKFLIEQNTYIFVIPFVDDVDHIFLKTTIPDRKETKKYIKGKETKYYEN